MSRRAEYHVDSRLIVTAENADAVRVLCVPSGRTVWVGRPAECCTIHTFRGVPGAKVDVLFQPAFYPDTPIACEVGIKAGCYDGAKRWRITFRHWFGNVVDPSDPRAGKAPWGHPLPGKVAVEEDHADPPSLAVLARWPGAGLWAQAFPQMRYVVDDRTDRIGIFLAQWKGWFRTPLPDIEDAKQLGEVWKLLPAVQAATDIVQLNRMASNMLYDESVRLGWRKLTLRDKTRLGLSPNAPQWHRVDGLILRQVGDGVIRPNPGIGQYTEEAAGGRKPMRPLRGGTGASSPGSLIPELTDIQASRSYVLPWA